MKSGKKVTISPDRGLKLWEGVCSPEKLDDQQADYLAGVRSIYLNWRTAPDDYIRENLATIIPLALNEWSLDAKGRPLRPATDFAWRFARRWGLWDIGGPTMLVLSPATLVAHPAVIY